MLCAMLSAHPSCFTCHAGRPVVLLKGGPGVGPLDVADANINLNAVLYRKKVAAGAAAGGGSSLSAGAIAGAKGKLRRCLTSSDICQQPAGIA